MQGATPTTRESGLSTILSDDPPLTLAQRLQALNWTAWAVRAQWLLAAVVVLAFVGAGFTGHALVSVPAAIGIVVAWLVVRLLFTGGERIALSVLLLAAFAVRMVAALILHPMLVTNVKRGDGRVDVFVGALFEDDRAFDVVSWALARLWSGQLAQTAKSQDYLINNYTVMMGWVYYLFGHDVVGPKLLNCLFGALTVVATYALAKELGGARAGWFAAVLAAFFPSLVLWSILNLKDALTVLLIAITMLGGLKFARRPSWIWAIVTIVAFAALENLRLYVFFGLGWLLWIAFFVINRAPWRQRLTIGVPFALALLSVVFITNQTQALGLRYLSAKRLEALAHSRGVGSDKAESGILDDDALVARSSEEGYSIQLRTAPRVLPYVLWGPFPWQARTRRDVAVIPETLVWYGLQALTIAALVGYRRERWREMSFPLAYCAGLAFVFSLIEGNVGTIYRHRAMLLIPAFAMASLGFVWVLDWRTRRQVAAPSVGASRVPDGARVVT